VQGRGVWEGHGGREGERAVSKETIEGRKIVPLPEQWRGRRVSLLDALLWGREQVRVRHALWLATGTDTVGSVPAFIKGWLANVQFNGGDDLAWQEFLDWLQTVKRESLSEGRHTRYLLECQGDHEKAAMRLFDAVAEYVEQFGSVPRGKVTPMDEKIAREYGALPKDWGGRQVPLMDGLLWMRERMYEGRELSSFTGLDTVDSLWCFSIGWCSYSAYNQRDEPGWEEFSIWLRDVKKEFPGEGWHVKYLYDCQGDHRKAVLKFLGFVAEYMELQRSGSL
jgi:hypothetical protein